MPFGEGHCGERGRLEMTGFLNAEYEAGCFGNAEAVENDVRVASLV